MPEYPVKYEVAYPERSNLWLVLARFFLGWLYIGIPHGIFMGLYGIAAFFVIIYSGLSIIFTSNYPKNSFDYLVRYQRYVNRVQAYWLCMVDEYPPSAAGNKKYFEVGKLSAHSLMDDNIQPEQG